MEFPLTLEIAKKYGWRDRNSDLTWFRRWLEANFDIKQDYKYDLLPQPINLAVANLEWDVSNWDDMIELYKNKILVLGIWDIYKKNKLYFPVKNNMIPRGDGFVNGIFVKIKLIRNDTFRFKKGWASFSSPTYTDKLNGIFGRNPTYTIIGVFKNETNNFMNWNDNPLR